MHDQGAATVGDCAFEVLPSIPGDPVLVASDAERTIHEVMTPRSGCRIVSFTLRVVKNLPESVVTQLLALGCGYGMSAHVAARFTDYNVLCYHRYEQAL